MNSKADIAYTWGMALKCLILGWCFMFSQTSVSAQDREVQTYYDLAVKALNNGNAKESVLYAGKALAIDEWNTEVLYVRATALEMDGKISEAIIDFEKITLEDKGFLEAYMAKAILYYRKKNYNEALRNLRAVEDYEGVKTTRAILFKSEGYGQGKSNGISAVTSINSLTNDLQYYKGLIFRDLNELVEARDIFKSLIARKRVPEYLVALGLVYERMNKTDSARYAYRTALSLNPRHQSAAYQLQLIDPGYEIPAAFADDESFHYNLAKKAYDLYQKREYTAALEMYNKAISLAPDDADYYASRGLVFEKLKRYDEAVEDFRSALARDSNFIVNFYRIGNVYFRQKLYKEAIAQYTIYLSYVPDDADILYNQGVAYLSSKESLKACQALEKAKAAGKSGIDNLLIRYCKKN